MRGGGKIVGVPGRVDAVDADEHLAGAEAAGLDRVDHLLARGFLRLGRDRILKVENDSRRPPTFSPFSSARALEPGIYKTLRRGRMVINPLQGRMRKPTVAARGLSSHIGGLPEVIGA